MGCVCIATNYVKCFVEESIGNYKNVGQSIPSIADRHLASSTLVAIKLSLTDAVIYLC